MTTEEKPLSINNNGVCRAAPGFASKRQQTKVEKHQSKFYVSLVQVFEQRFNETQLKLPTNQNLTKM